MVHVKRALFPIRVRGGPKLLQNGKLVEATPHCQREGSDLLNHCEDILIWDSLRVAIISNDPARPVFNAFSGEGTEAHSPVGQLLLYHLDSRQIKPLQITGWPQGRPLHPLGIGFVETSPSKEGVLALANYQQHAASIEVLQLRVSEASPLSISAIHLRSIEHPGVTSPNAVVPLSESQILFTNSYGYSPRLFPLRSKLEQISAYPGGALKSLQIADSGDIACTTLASRIALANGLALNTNKTILAVAGSTSHNIHVYDVLHDKYSFSLKFRKTIQIGFLPDNLRFISQGDSTKDEVLLAAGHPSALDYLKTAKSSGRIRAASRVVKISVSKAQDVRSGLWHKLSSLFQVIGEEVHTVFESLGNFYGTSSTATAFKGEDGKQEMLLTSLWEHGIMRCTDVDVS